MSLFSLLRKFFPSPHIFGEFLYKRDVFLLFFFSLTSKYWFIYKSWMNPPHLRYKLKFQITYKTKVNLRLTLGVGPLNHISLCFFFIRVFKKYLPEDIDFILCIDCLLQCSCTSCRTVRQFKVQALLLGSQLVGFDPKPRFNLGQNGLGFSQRCHQP